MILMTSSLTCRDILASMPRGCYEETASVEYKLYRGGVGGNLVQDRVRQLVDSGSELHVQDGTHDDVAM